MTTVAILPVPTEKGGLSYRGVAGDKRSQGSTRGEALDALAAQLGDDGTSLFVVVQSLRPDRFFTAAQQQRLSELMEQWRTAQDRNECLPPEQQAELDALVKAELFASADRTVAFTTRDYLEQRAGRGDRAKFEQALAKVGNLPPEAEDAL